MQEHPLCIRVYSFVVKVYAQESTFVVWQDCIKTNYIATILIFALQMAIVVLGSQRGKLRFGHSVHLYFFLSQTPLCHLFMQTG